MTRPGQTSALQVHAVPAQGLAPPFLVLLPSRKMPAHLSSARTRMRPPRQGHAVPAQGLAPLFLVLLPSRIISAHLSSARARMRPPRQGQTQGRRCLRATDTALTQQSGRSRQTPNHEDGAIVYAQNDGACDNPFQEKGSRSCQAHQLLLHCTRTHVCAHTCTGGWNEAGRCAYGHCLAQLISG